MNRNLLALTTVTRALWNFKPHQFSAIRGLSTYSQPDLLKTASAIVQQQNNSVLFVQLRFSSSAATSFFAKVSADQLWKGMTSVSNAGKKRGRGKGINKARTKDLNRGQIIGIGSTNMLWPGLNAPILMGKELVQQKQLPPDPERQSKLIKLRDTMGQFRPMTLSPLERGWSGTKMHGRSIGPPDPIGMDKFEGFDTKVLEMKTVVHMDGVQGRVRRFCVVAFTGNKNGLCGVAFGRSPEGRAALRRAKNRAGQRLLYVHRYNDHTVLHDFYTRYGRTKIFVYKKQEGFGLVCHRAIRTMCELIGIKDLYAKIEGSTNLQHIVKAFILGLVQQKRHEDFAKEKKLYLVEQRGENNNLPIVVASPQGHCRKETEIKPEETIDFCHVAMGDRVPLRKPRKIPFYQRMPSWRNHLLKTEWKRNHESVQLQLMKDHGFGASHLTDIYPEAHSFYHLRLLEKKLRQQAEEQETT